MGTSSVVQRSTNLAKVRRLSRLLGQVLGATFGSSSTHKGFGREGPPRLKTANCVLSSRLEVQETCFAPQAPTKSTSENRQQGPQLPSDWSDPHRQPFALGFPRKAWAAAMERPDASQQCKALKDDGYIMMPIQRLGFSSSHSVLACMTNSFGWPIMRCSKQHCVYKVAQQRSCWCCI